MKKYSYEQIDKHVQWLIKMMNIEYPNGYELVIDSNSGKIRSTQENLFFLNEDLKNCCGRNNKPLLQALVDQNNQHNN